MRRSAPSALVALTSYNDIEISAENFYVNKGRPGQFEPEKIHFLSGRGDRGSLSPKKKVYFVVDKVLL